MTDVLQQLNKVYCNCPAGPAGKEVGYLCSGTCLDYMYDKLDTKFAYGFEIFDGEKGTGVFSNVRKADGVNLLQANEQVRSTSRDRLKAMAGLGVFGKGTRSCFMKETAQQAAEAPAVDHAEHLHASVRAQQQQQAPAAAATDGHRHDDFWFDKDEPLDTDSALLAIDEQMLAGAKFPEPRDHVAKTCLSQFNPTTKEMYDQTVDNWSRGYLETIWLSMKEQ